MSVRDCATVLEIPVISFQERDAGMFTCHMLIFFGNDRATVRNNTHWDEFPSWYCP